MKITNGLKVGGFTLIELMVALVIISILAMVAYPAYQNNIARARRADAQGDLMSLANVMERQFTANSTYMGAGTVDIDGDGNGDTGAPATFSPTSPAAGGGQPIYTLTIAPAPAPTQTTYTLVATPIPGGPQATDGILTLTQAGVRGWDRNSDGDTADAGENTWNQP